MATTSSVTLNAAEDADVIEREAEVSARIAYIGPATSAAAPAPDSRKAEARVLNRTIEDEIIPRLLTAYAAGPAAPGAPADGPTGAGRAAPATATALLDAQDVARFADQLVGPDAEGAQTVLATMRRRGLGLESIYMELMGPAARLLGEDWSEDRRSFADVTLGLARLQTMMRGLSPIFSDVDPPTRTRDAQDRRILLAPTPGEQHTFGVSMVEEFFRRDGWEVSIEGGAGESLLAAAVSVERFAVVGLSLCRDDLIDPLQSAIRSIRQHSLNADVSILVGGRVFAEDPSLAHRIGADDHAIDARDAVARAERLIGAAATI